MSAGALINRFLGLAGLKLVRATRPAPPPVAPPAPKGPDQAGKARHLAALTADPANAAAHLAYAGFCLEEGWHDLAFAEARTARFLGADGTACSQLAGRVAEKLSPLEEMAHNRYYRMHSIAKAIDEFGPNASVLDVGGGWGELARFIPEHPYCLSEPFANGISSLNLPFAEGTFDLVVSCHVLEHIPHDQRDAFLDTLVRNARKAVILLNPFHSEHLHDVERMQLVWDELKSQWAKEHLDCGLPRLEEVQDYAQRRGLHCTIRPNATVATSYSLIWMDAFMDKPASRSTWHKVNRFFNTRLMDIMDSPTAPTAWLVVLRRP